MFGAGLSGGRDRDPDCVPASVSCLVKGCDSARSWGVTVVLWVSYLKSLLWMGGSAFGGRAQREGGVPSPSGGVLVSEKLEVEWDLAWPSRVSPKAEVKRPECEAPVWVPC